MKLFARLMVMLISLLVGTAYAANPQTSESSASTFSPEQTRKIQEIIHDYLLENPNVMVEVIKKLQQQQQEEMEQKAVDAIKKNRAKLFNAKSSPIAGNKNGSVTLVEFFDYQCGHCKKMTEVVDNLIKTNPDLRVVYKEFPIFPGSDAMSAAALEAQKQGKYKEFHDALMASQGNNKQSSKTELQNIASKLGLSAKAVADAAKDPAIKQELQDNFQLAEALGLAGTPAFIISNNSSQPNKLKIFFAPGEVKEAELQDYINQAKR